MIKNSARLCCRCVQASIRSLGSRSKICCPVFAGLKLRRHFRFRCSAIMEVHLKSACRCSSVSMLLWSGRKVLERCSQLEGICCLWIHLLFSFSALAFSSRPERLDRRDTTVTTFGVCLDSSCDDNVDVSYDRIGLEARLSTSTPLLESYVQNNRAA